MQKTELEGPELQQAYQKLLVYSALDNKVRFRAFFLISEKPGIKFNDIAKRINVRKSLLAYHLGLLKASELVTFRYERKGKATSSYWLTDRGKMVKKELVAGFANWKSAH